jgi:Fe-S oxidoreductase
MDNTMLVISPYIQYVRHPGMPILIDSWLVDERVTLDTHTCFVLWQCREPQYVNELRKQYGEEIINFLCVKKLLLPVDKVWEQNNIRLVELECTTFCNYKCEYCTIPVIPRDHCVMDMILFERIIEKVLRHPSIQWISLNNYGEPSIDPLLMERLDVIAQTDLQMVFNTNGSRLEPFLDRLRCMKKNIYHLNFNIPSIDRDEYHQITGGDLMMVLKNVKKANDLGITTKIIVNGTPDEVERKYIKFLHMFQAYENVEVYKWKTNDRSGILSNKYWQNVKNSYPLTGCRNLVNYLFIDGKGDLFLCCNDYNKKFVYNNIKNGEIRDLLHSPKLIEWKKIIFGNKNGSKEFICMHCAEMRESLCASYKLNETAKQCHSFPYNG